MGSNGFRWVDGQDVIKEWHLRHDIDFRTDTLSIHFADDCQVESLISWVLFVAREGVTLEFSCEHGLRARARVGAGEEEPSHAS